MPTLTAYVNADQQLTPTGYGQQNTSMIDIQSVTKGSIFIYAAFKADVSAIVGKQISSAYLYVAPTGGWTSTYIQCYSQGSDWTEGTGTAAPSVFQDQRTLPTGNVRFPFNVGTVAATWAAGAPNYGCILRHDNATNSWLVSVWAREEVGSNVPYYQITYNTAPTTPGAFTEPDAGVTYNNSIAVAWGASTDPDGDSVGYNLDYSTNGTTWTNISNGILTNSYTWDTSALPASTTYRLRVRAADNSGTGPGFSAYTTSSNFTIQHNQTPTAPTLGTPANAATLDLAAGATFSWTFNDPDAGDTQSAYYFRRKIGAGSYEYWTGSAWTGTETKVTSTTSSVTFGSGKWTNGNTYDWSVACEDALGVKSPYATNRSVIASTAPVATVTYPVTTVTDTSLPVVQWSYSDADSDAQESWQVRVFSAAQYGAGGFDPSSSSATWDSTKTASVTARDTQVMTSLTDGVTYRAYVRCWATGDAASAWAYSQFTVTLTAPEAPALTATADNANNRVVLVVTGTHVHADFPTTTFRIECSDDDGDTWATVRGADAIEGTGTPDPIPMTAYDYEAHPNAERLYRAITVAEV